MWINNETELEIPDLFLSTEENWPLWADAHINIQNAAFLRKRLKNSYYMVFDVYSGFKGNAIFKNILKMLCPTVCG